MADLRRVLKIGLSRSRRADWRWRGGRGDDHRGGTGPPAARCSRTSATTARRSTSMAFA